METAQLSRKSTLGQERNKKETINFYNTTNIKAQHIQNMRHHNNNAKNKEPRQTVSEVQSWAEEYY